MPDDVGEKEFLEAYEKYADAIYRHCYFRVYDKDAAQDLTQETFIKTYNYLQEGKEIKNIKSFLYRVAVNLIIDASRKKTAVTLDEVKEKEVSKRLNSIEGEFIRAFEVKQIISLLDQLDEKYRQVIVLRYIDELSPKEIAAALGQTTSVISMRLNYALKKMKELVIQKHYES